MTMYSQGFTPDDLIVDTGSSNTWVGAGTKYVTTPTSKKSGGSVVCPAFSVLAADMI